ncbi:MAG: hypothetical protein R3B97_15785 [Dehalococcoidia bacterium]|nr:hypothetical protein [Dehalococcoidia bacterium]
MLIELIYDYDQRTHDAQFESPAARHGREWRINHDVDRLEQKLSAARSRLQGQAQFAAE